MDCRTSRGFESGVENQENARTRGGSYTHSPQSHCPLMVAIEIINSFSGALTVQKVFGDSRGEASITWACYEGHILHYCLHPYTAALQTLHTSSILEVRDRWVDATTGTSLQRRSIHHSAGGYRVFLMLLSASSAFQTISSLVLDQIMRPNCFQ